MCFDGIRYSESYFFWSKIRPPRPCFLAGDDRGQGNLQLSEI